MINVLIALFFIGGFFCIMLAFVCVLTMVFQSDNSSKDFDSKAPWALQEQERLYRKKLDATQSK